MHYKNCPVYFHTLMLQYIIFMDSDCIRRSEKENKVDFSMVEKHGPSRRKKLIKIHQ